MISVSWVMASVLPWGSAGVLLRAQYPSPCQRDHNGGCYVSAEGKGCERERCAGHAIAADGYPYRAGVG